MKRKRNKCDTNELNYKIIKEKQKSSLYVLDDLDKELLEKYHKYKWK